MKKTITFFKSLLLAVILLVGSGSAWGQKITDVANIVSGQSYYIGATTGGTDYYLSVSGDGSTIGASLAGTAVTKASANIFTFVSSGSTWTIQFDSGNYLSLKTTKDNGKVSVQTTAADFTISNQNSLLKMGVSTSYSIQKNNSTTNFGNYDNKQTYVWLEPAVAACTPPSTSFTSSTVNKLTTDAAFTNAFTSDNTSTKVWSSTNTAVATVNSSTGLVTMVGAGTTNIKVNQAADATYCAVVDASYALTVTAPSYSITPTSNNESFGTVSLSGAVITGAPASGYTYATPAYTVLSGTATVSQSGNAFTVSPTSDCAVQINFEAKPHFTLSLNNDGDAFTNTNFPFTTYEGNTITLPTLDNCGTNTFVGWDTNSSTTSAPTYAGGATYTTTSANVTLYAVYSQTTGGGTVTSNLSASIVSTLETMAYASTYTKDIDGKTWTFTGCYRQNASANNLQMNSTNTRYIQTPDMGSEITSVKINVKRNAAGNIGIYTTTGTLIKSIAVTTSANDYIETISGYNQVRIYNSETVVTNFYSVEVTADASTTTYTTAPNCNAAQITISETELTGFGYVENDGPSAEQSFTVSGVNLTNDISIAATTNYEISKTSGSGYATPLTFTPAEAATAQTVYVRLKSGLSQGAYNNEVINVTSTGADAKTVTVSGSVTEQINAEPSAHATGFAAVEDGQNAITLSWTDASGADGYLIKASAVSYAAIAAPVDGTPESDAALVKNVAQGAEIVEFTGLAASTTYYFKIWPYSNSAANIDYKTDGSVPQASAMTDAIVRPNVIITEVYGGGGNTGATFKNDFIELYNTTNSPIDISGWSIQYYSAAGTTPGTNGSNVHAFPSGSIIPAKSHFLIQQAAGTGGTTDLFEPNVSGTLAMSGTSGKVILFTINTAQTITSDISSVTGHVNFKDYLPFGASTPVWGSAMSATTNTTSATRKKVSGEYVYSQNIGNDFEAVTPTPQNSGKYRTKGSGNLNDNLNWEFTDNGTWIDVASAPDNNGRGVEIEAGHEMTINANASLSAVTLKPGAKLTLNNGHSFSPGTFTLESNATGTATFVDKRSNGNKTNITAIVKRHLPAASTRTWWYLASPVSGAASTVFGSNKVGDYSETTRSYSNPFTEATTLTAGKGYVVKMTAKSAANYIFENKTLNTGNISVPLTRTVTETPDNAKRGFNLVGNPYPSYLNWDLAYNNSTNVRSTIWYRTLNGASMEFHTYNATLNASVPSSASGYIPPMQAFWVKVDKDPTEGSVSNGTLNFTNDMRSHDLSALGNPLKAPAADRQLVRLSISNGTLSDETVIVTHPSASDNYDSYDSEKMANGDTNRPEIFSMAGSQELVINGISPLTDSKQIALGVRPGRAGNYTISLTEWRNTGNLEAVLRDNQLGEELILTESSSYSFDTDGSTSTSRFSLLFRAKGSNTGFDRISSDLLIYASQKSIRVESASLEGNTISIFNALGQPVFNSKAQSNRLEINGLTPAVYMVKVNNQTKMVIVK